MFVARVLVVSGAKCEWCVHEVQIHVVEPKSVQARMQGRLYSFGSVIGVPQLGGDKEIFALNRSGDQARVEYLAYLAFVAISFGTVEVAKSGFQCVSGRADRDGRVRDQGAESKCGHACASVVQRQ